MLGHVLALGAGITLASLIVATTVFLAESEESRKARAPRGSSRTRPALLLLLAAVLASMLFYLLGIVR